ncbi:MAG: endonuclease III [Eubacteriales bacterium]|nr:endonuclease III [Eubacteriales bacterium]
MTKKERVLKIKEILDIEYGEAECSLQFEKPYELLIATQLAAQCTDARVNMVTPALFERYPSIKALAEADINELMIYIHSTGFYRNKAKNIIGCCKKLLSEYNGEVPDTMEELLTLDGVGRKTANIILGDVYKKPAMVIDTHAGRLARRMGLTKNTDPVKVEFDLIKIVPPEYTATFGHQLVWHGRKYCMSRKPDCVNCPVREVCPKII